MFRNDDRSSLLCALHSEREFLQMSVRGMYKYVIETVTTPTIVPNIASVTEAGGNATDDDSTSKEGDADDAPKENKSDDGESQSSREEITYRDRLGTLMDQEACALCVIVCSVSHQMRILLQFTTGGYLHPRDLRRLTSPFSASNEPELMVRRHVILCNFDPLRAIILRDRLLVIVPDGADSMLAELERRVRGGIEEYENSVFGDVEEESESIHRYDRKPSGGALGGVKKAVKKSAKAVKKVIGRNSRHNADTIPPPPPPVSSPQLAIPKETPENTISIVPIEDENEFAELDSAEWNDLKGNDWKEMPFELKCADGTSTTHDHNTDGCSLLLRLFSTYFLRSHSPCCDRSTVCGDFRCAGKIALFSSLFILIEDFSPALVLEPSKLH